MFVHPTFLTILILDQVIQIKGFYLPSPLSSRFALSSKLDKATKTSFWYKEVDAIDGISILSIPEDISISDKSQTSEERETPNITEKKSKRKKFSIFSPMLNDYTKTCTLENRAYSKADPFGPEMLYESPTLSDLSSPKKQSRETFWTSVPAVLSSFIIPYLSFPYLVQFLDGIIVTHASTLGDIEAKFGPGVAILYGTFVSITLSLLYKRQEDIQDIVSKESSQLAATSRNALTLFKEDKALAIAAGQCIADQIRTLSTKSRGDELLLIMNDDPYGRIMELAEKLEDQWLDSTEDDDTRRRSTLLETVRENIQELYELRASRLAHEALSLPPTHFFILTCLTNLILLGYTIRILPSVTYTAMGTAVPSPESSLLFGILCTIYVLFYNTATDLNTPFSGIYQIRRGSIASHFMQVKSFIINHPILKGNIKF